MSISNELSLSQGYSESTLHQTAFTWTIDNFSYRNSTLLSPVFNEGKKILTIFPTFLISKSGIDAQFKVSLINSNGEKKLIYNKFHDVSDTLKFEITNLIYRSTLLAPSNGYLPGDTLTLHCEIGFVEHNKSFLKAGLEIDKVETTQKAMKDYGRLLKSGNLADVKLIVGDKTIPAHSQILSARSPVFAAMFAHDTKEKQEGQVEIPDLNPEAFEIFLKFLYTGGMPTFENAKSAQELLIVADKYDAAQLKTVCEAYLIKEMINETAPSLLLFANSVNTPKLKEKALEVIGSRCSELVDSLKSEPDKLMNLFQDLAIKEEEKYESK